MYKGYPGRAGIGAASTFNAIKDPVFFCLAKI
ncbi:unnamed protein product, partial [marine sediment metagenome]